MTGLEEKRKFRQVSLHAASTILWREMRVLWRSKFSELMVTIASPLTFFLALGLGLSEDVNDVEGRPYLIFMAPGLISMAAVTYWLQLLTPSSLLTPQRLVTKFCTPKPKNTKPITTAGQARPAPASHRSTKGRGISKMPA